MRKAAPPNIEPGDGRDSPCPIDHGPAGARGWNWRGGPLRSLLVAFLALGLVGAVLIGHREEKPPNSTFNRWFRRCGPHPTASLCRSGGYHGATAISPSSATTSARLRYARARAPLKTVMLASFCWLCHRKLRSPGRLLGRRRAIQALHCRGPIAGPDRTRNPVHLVRLRRRACLDCRARPRSACKTGERPARLPRRSRCARSRRWCSPLAVGFLAFCATRGKRRSAAARSRSSSRA